MSFKLHPFIPHKSEERVNIYFSRILQFYTPKLIFGSVILFQKLIHGFIDLLTCSVCIYRHLAGQFVYNKQPKLNDFSFQIIFWDKITIKQTDSPFS